MPFMTSYSRGDVILDEAREVEALEWAEAMLGDAAVTGGVS